MPEGKPQENMDKIAEAAWNQLVEHGGGSFEIAYLAGEIRGENEVFADVRLYKLADFQGGGFMVYINDIGSSFGFDPKISEESATASEVETVVNLVKALRTKGVDVKRVGIQASNASYQKLQEPIDKKLKE